MLIWSDPNEVSVCAGAVWAWPKGGGRRSKLRPKAIDAGVPADEVDEWLRVAQLTLVLLIADPECSPTSPENAAQRMERMMDKLLVQDIAFFRIGALFRATLKPGMALPLPLLAIPKPDAPRFAEFARDVLGARAAGDSILVIAERLLSADLATGTVVAMLVALKQSIGVEDVAGELAGHYPPQLVEALATAVADCGAFARLKPTTGDLAGLDYESLLAAVMKLMPLKSLTAGMGEADGLSLSEQREMLAGFASRKEMPDGLIAPFMRVVFDSEPSDFQARCIAAGFSREQAMILKEGGWATGS